MQYTVSQAVRQDLPAIVAIYNSAVETRQSTADLAPVGTQDRQAWFEAHTGNRPLYVLKKPNGRSVGVGQFQRLLSTPRLPYQRGNQHLCPS